jgi:two-component system LytT family response regulator
LHRLLLRDADIQVVGIAADGKTAIEEIERLQPDIVFLDIQIPEVDGFGVIEAIGAHKMPIVVFVTAYDQYTLRAFEVHALDYLLKPFDDTRFSATLARVKRELAVRRHLQGEKLSTLLQQSNRALSRLPIKSGGKVMFLHVDEIDYIEAAGNYIRLHVGPQEFLTRETMNAFEAKLSLSEFVRIHRSVIVNRRRIRELKPWFTGEYAVILETGKELTLSRGYRDRLPLLLSAQ